MPNRSRRARGRGEAFRTRPPSAPDGRRAQPPPRAGAGLAPRIRAQPPPRAGAGLAPRLDPIAGGVFKRLKIPRDTSPSVLTSPTQKICNFTALSTIIPITFRGLPSLIEGICFEMSRIKASGSYSDTSDTSDSSDSDFVDPNDLNNEENKSILIKGALILAEVKVYCADMCNKTLWRYNSWDFLPELESVARNLPKPLVEYLECIGVSQVGQQMVTPVLAGAGGAGDEGHGGAAPALAPCQLAPLLARLRGGVEAGGPADPRAALRALRLRWVEADGTLRLADDCFRRWVADAGPDADPRYTLRWDYEHSRKFERIINSVRVCKGGDEFFASIDLTRRDGSPAQFVQTPGWEEFGCYSWYTMTRVGEEDRAKGAAFGFGGAEPQQPSRFTGTIETSYQSGHYSRYSPCTVVDMKNLSTGPLFGTIIPVTFSGLPGLVDSFWAESQLDRTDNPDSKAIFIKAGLILAEAKVYFAQMASKHTILHPGQMVKYSSEQESILRRMPRWLPKPLAIYLECIGNTYAEGQEVTPVLAGAGGAGDEGHGGAAPALAPCQLAPLLARLRGGVEAGGPADPRAALRALPLRWVEADGTLRLADDCFRRWVADAGPHADPRYTLRWDDEDSRLFETVIRVMRPTCRLVYTDLNLTHGEGSPAQFVRSCAGTDGWFAMTEVDDASLKLGVMFGFGGAGLRGRPTRLAGPPAFALFSVRDQNILLTNLGFVFND